MESFPFDQETLVFKVLGKVFLLTSLTSWEEGAPRINVKCYPKEAIRLRREFPEQIFPGYHMNKKHWNTVAINLGFTDREIFDFINHSYTCVLSKLPKKQLEQLKKSAE